LEHETVIQELLGATISSGRDILDYGTILIEVRNEGVFGICIRGNFTRVQHLLWSSAVHDIENSRMISELSIHAGEILTVASTIVTLVPVDDYVHVLVGEQRHYFSDSSVTAGLVANRVHPDIVSIQLISLTFICLSVEG
jgi:hypothetical protein